MNRIPLWIDARGADDAIIQAAKDVEAERIIEAVQGDTVVDRDGVEIARFVTIGSADDQTAAAQAPGRILVTGRDWTIIPLENLIAARRDRPDSLYAVATDPQQAGVFRDTLDVGVHGIVLKPSDAQAVHDTHAMLVARGPRPDDAPGQDGDLRLEEATVTRIQDAGTGDRVCVDATTAFSAGEGLLVGSSARGFALIHAETLESEYVRARPFRVNAGALHSYVLAPGGRTRYLSELAGGDEVLCVDAQGGTRGARVGRAKVERRPHLLVAWQAPHGEAHVIVQNAETIRFMGPDGPISVTALKTGDRILVHHEASARHFGMAVEERLIER